MTPEPRAFDPQHLREAIRAQGLALGFARVGFTSADPLPRGDALQQWLDSGMHGEMDFMRRQAEQRHLPHALLPSANTMIVVAARYADGTPSPPVTDHGRIARYALGADYHAVLKQRLKALGQWIGAQLPSNEPFDYRACVDTAPLLEREAAMRAGIGFIGKNSLLISPGVGSFTLLGVLLISLDLPHDEPAQPRCGSCTLCLDACPTNALTAPQVLDARRCISYLTIEHRGAIDDALKDKMGDWVYGCDICQEVCPYNHPLPGNNGSAVDPAIQATRPATVDLSALLDLRSSAYRRLVSDRALRRAPRKSWIRNGAIAVGNLPRKDQPRYRPLLKKIADFADHCVRDAVRWALRENQNEG